MFLVYFLFTSYYQGDETLNMDSLAANSSLNILENNNVNWQVSAYPNPSSEQVRFAFNLDHPSNVALQIMDLNGKIVYQRDYGKIFYWITTCLQCSFQWKSTCWHLPILPKSWRKQEFW